MESQRFAPLRQWLSERFAPTSLVFSSPAVRDTLLKQSSLSPAELFRPFSIVGDLNNVALQTCEKNQPFRLQKFRVNFIDSHKLDRQAQFDNSMLVDYIIQNNAPKKFQDIQSSSKDTDQQLKKKILGLLDYHRYEQLTPWFSKWKRQFLQQTMFSDHELINQPISFIYFIMATEHDPLGTIDVLKRADNLPSLYKEGIYDDSSQSVQHYIFILNPSENQKVFQDATDVVKQKYSISNIFEIRMSRAPESMPPLDDLWKRLTDLDEQGIMMELNMDGNLIRGSSFSESDRDNIQRVLKKVIEKGILPFIEKRIKILEGSVANTRKGIKNQFKSLWKKSERGENDGLKDNFKMNKEELELRNLVDLAMVCQDYETAVLNGKLPYSDFKKCKAQRHAASCQEILAFSQVAFDSTQNSTTPFKEVEAMLENAYQLYHKGGKIQYLLRCALYMYELYEKLDKPFEAANILLRITNELKDNSVIIPLFQEQAAYKYLKMKNFRKFALYLVLAGKSYERLNLQSYSFNCFTMVDPFYQRYGKGWNGIRFQLYSNLGRNSQNMGDNTLAVQFFRNLLQLCTEFENMNEQKSCLNEFLIAVQNWSSQRSMNLLDVEDGSHQQTKKAHIGQLNLPIIQEDSIDIYLSTDKLYSNKPELLVNNLYYAHASSVISSDDNQEYVIQQKAELNTNNCPWKFMAKHLFELMNDERRKNVDIPIQQEACQFNQEELNEFGIYDCTSRIRKRELTISKVRKSFVGESLVVRLLMRNPLMADIFINNIKLICRFENSEQSSADDFEQLERNIVLRSLETKEIIIEITPKRSGRFIIERLEWILFDVVSCAYQMVKPTDKDKKILTQEELQVSKKLLDRENNFIYDVLEKSGEITAKVQVHNEGSDQQQNTFIFTEMQRAELQVRNVSPNYTLKNGYAVCSHPMIFGFSRMRLFDKIEKGEKFILPLRMRASLMQSNEVKFLIRYEVENEQDAGEVQNKMSKYRFCRLVFNLESLYAFTPKRHVHLSSKKVNEHIFNIQIVDNFAPGSALYQTPQINSIEIINKRKLWTLKQKDEKGQFFIIIPTLGQEDETQSLLSYGDQSLGASIFEDADKKNYFDQEQAFVMTKFKMQPTNEEEEVDIVIQWSMPQLKKRGFYCLFKVPLLKMHKQLTEQQRKIQRQRSNLKTKEIQGMRELPRIQPLHLAYSYQKVYSHDFSSNKPAILTFSLSLSNMIQSSDIDVNCKVEALNDWSSASNPSDVSESNSFLWVGKTQHVIRHLKSNAIKKVELRCAILKPGVFNLNRFRVTILDGSEEATANAAEQSPSKHHFVKEIRLPDDILVTVNDIERKLVENVVVGSQNLIEF